MTIANLLLYTYVAIEGVFGVGVSIWACVLLADPNQPAAFSLGVLPLVFASGAGAGARHSIGTTVLGGMLASTFLSLLVVPVFYVVIQWVRERFNMAKEVNEAKANESS